MFTTIKRYLALSVLLLTSMAVHAVDTITPHGKEVRFTEAVDKGKWNLVLLWSHDCIPCERQKPLLGRFYRDYKDLGVTVKGLSTDSVKDRKKSMAALHKRPTNFSNYLYNGTSFERDYLAMIGERFIATPTYLVFDDKGILFGTHVGTLNRQMLNGLFRDKVRR